MVEVLSPGTERYDRGEKFMEYQSLPSFREYALVLQDKPEVMLMTKNEAGAWAPREAAGLENAVYFESVDVSVELSRIYKNVDLR